VYRYTPYKTDWLLSGFGEAIGATGEDERQHALTRTACNFGVTAMASPLLVNLSSLVDDAKCYALVRQHRWPDGVRCPQCNSADITRNGRDDPQPHRQRYRCRGCDSRFDDLTGTVLAGHHQPLRVWVLCLYFMGLNLSNRQIARELDLNVSDVQVMTEQLRAGLTAKIPPVSLEGEVEIDEVDVVAGHKGHPDAVAQKGAPGDGGG
jgi:transposase-like protein